MFSAANPLNAGPAPVGQPEVRLSPNDARRAGSLTSNRPGALLERLLAQQDRARSQFGALSRPHESAVLASAEVKDQRPS